MAGFAAEKQAEGLFANFTGTNAIGFQESIGEIAGRGEADFVGDLRDVLVCGLEQFSAPFEANGADEYGRRMAGQRLDLAEDLAAAHTGRLR